MSLSHLFLDLPPRFSRARLRKIRVSLGGGRGPRWSSDGSELFYFAEGRGIMAVTITRDPDFQAGIPEVIFETNLRYQGGEAFFDVSNDGQRFLITRETDQATTEPLTVRSGWTWMLSKGSR